MKIQVSVEKILFHEMNYCIFKQRLNQSSIICKGKCPWKISEKDMVDLAGEFVEYKGEKQFRFNQIFFAVLEDSRTTLNYVCSHVSQLGPKTQGKIWDKFGTEWRKLEYGNIPKISQTTIDEFKKFLQEMENNEEKNKCLVYLLSIGCTEKMAICAIEKWGINAPGIIRENCYTLTQLPGVSFKYIDEKIRLKLNIKDDSEYRIKSQIYYAFEKFSEFGDNVFNCNQFLKQCKDLLYNVAEAKIIEITKNMANAGEVLIDRDENLILLEKDYQHETAILDYVKSNEPDIIKWEIDKNGISEEQYNAVKQALHNKFSIIYGGAGTGKSTIIKTMVESIIKTSGTENKLILCAPTGKQAARIKEVCNIEAKTVHCILKASGNMNEFLLDTLKKKIVIIDEASMIDSSLLYEVIKRDPEKLVLLGDSEQIPPVSAGQPFHDLINHFNPVKIQLNTCYRNKEAIFKVSDIIRNGNIPPRSLISDNEKWIVEEIRTPEEVEEVLMNWAENGIFDLENDIVLCPKNGKFMDQTFQKATVNSINQAFAKIHRKKNNMTGSWKFLPGDRILCLKNMPVVNIWNGTTGKVQALDDENNLFIQPDGEERTVKFDKEMQENLTLAYAMTIHKAQGSQYDNVFIILMQRDLFQLNKNLVYTAVTRAKKKCVVLGNYSTLAESVIRNNKKNTILNTILKKV